MSISKIHKALLCMALAVAGLVVFAGSPTAHAQCAPCPTWWVEYDYIWPPCDTTADTVFVDVDWSNGTTTSVWSVTDGHIIYPADPTAIALRVRVNGVNIVIGAPPVKIPYTCGSMPNMCLQIEARCNPCLEVKIKLVPC